MKTWTEKLTGAGAYAYLIPCFAIFGLFLFYPFFNTLYLSFYNTDKLVQAKLFFGSDNYMDLLTSDAFYNIIVVKLICFVIVVTEHLLQGIITA